MHDDDSYERERRADLEAEKEPRTRPRRSNTSNPLAARHRFQIAVQDSVNESLIVKLSCPLCSGPVFATRDARGELVTCQTCRRVRLGLLPVAGRQCLRLSHAQARFQIAVQDSVNASLIVKLSCPLCTGPVFATRDARGEIVTCQTCGRSSQAVVEDGNVKLVAGKFHGSVTK